jgi:hypothetical protein
MKCDNKICGKCGNMFCYITDVTHICKDEPIREIHFSCLNNNAGVFFPPYYSIIEIYKLNKDGVFENNEDNSITYNYKLQDIFNKTDSDNFYGNIHNDCLYKLEHIMKEWNNK